MEKKVTGIFKDDRGNVYKFYVSLRIDEKEVSIKSIDSLVINDTIKIQPNFMLKRSIWDAVMATDEVIGLEHN